MNMERLRRYVLLDIARKDLESRMAVLKTVMNNLGDEIFQELTDEGVDEQQIGPTFKKEEATIVLFSDGRPRIVKRSSEPKPHVNEGDKESFFQWLKDNEHGAIVKESVNAGTLESWVKQQRKLNQPIPEQVKIFDRQSVKISMVPLKKSDKKGRKENE